MDRSVPTQKLDPDLDPAAWRSVQTLWVGAICSVEKVELQATRQQVVLKHMHAEHLPDPGIAARCLNEALILRRLHADGDISGIPRLFEVGFLPNGCPCLLMELLGDSLAEKLDAPGWPPEGSAQSVAAQLRIGHQVAATLAQIHTRGVVHRDVRTDNILFGPDSSGSEEREPAAATFLIDFGLAKTASQDGLLPISTGDEDILGTDEYMAPEQWESAKHVTGAADVYSLGVVLYRLASGRLPFTDPRRQVLMYQHLVIPPEPLPTYVPRPLARLILGMLAKRSKDRPHAAECADLLRSME